MTQANAYRAPSMQPHLARLLNGFLTRAVPWPVRAGDSEGLLEPLPGRAEFTPAALLYIKESGRPENGSPWLLELSAVPFAALPPLRRTDADALPVPLRQAVLETLCLPLIDSLQRAMGRPLMLAQSVLMDDQGRPETDPALFRAEEPLCDVFFRLNLNGPCEATIFARLCVPDEQGAALLHDFLRSLPLRPWEESVIAAADPPVPVFIQAASMRLSVEELNSLRQGDVLLPLEYGAARDRVLLRIGRAPGPVWSSVCSVHNGMATINEAPRAHADLEEDMVEEDMMEEEDIVEEHYTPENDESPFNLVDEAAPFRVEELEVVLSFELERRSMSVREAAALCPGYTFALAGAPDGPVTLRVNGKAVGEGRLVDLNGTLGVRIAALF